MLKVVLLSLACLVGVALTQEPLEEGRRCCAPQQFEGLLVETGAYYVREHHKDGVFAKHIGVHYDGEGERVALRLMENHARVIFNYPERRAYFIRTGNCTYVPMYAHFKEPCIPEEARYRGAFDLGFGDNRVHLHAWSAPVYTREGGKFYASFTIEPESCMPITEVAVGHVRGVDSFLTLSYADLSAGIRDPSVFYPPHYCRQADEQLDFDEMAIYGYMMNKHTKDFLQPAM